MKRIALFIMIGCLASCAPREKLITRAWKFKDVDFGNNTTDSAALAFYDNARYQMKTNLDFTMEADSTYTIMQLRERRATRGKWWFSADKKKLYTKTELGLTECKVVKLTKKSLVYETKDPSGKNIRMFCVAKEPAGSK